MDIRQHDIIDELLDDLRDDCNTYATHSHASYRIYTQVNTFYSDYYYNKTPSAETKKFATELISYLFVAHNEHRTATENANRVRRIVQRLRQKRAVTTADIQMLNYYLCNESHISPREIDEYLEQNDIQIEDPKII